MASVALWARRQSLFMWLWIAALVVGGCGIVEGLRQSAYVERLRAQQQQERADQMRIIAGKTQDALRVLEAALPQDDSASKALIEEISTAQGMIVERAVAITNAAVKSEEWQTADAEAIGQPKKPVKPDTSAEDTERSDFERRARTAGQVRRAAQTLGHVIKGTTGIPLGNSNQSDSGIPWTAGGVGLTLLTLAGGGMGVKKLLKNGVDSVKSQVSHLMQNQQETQQKGEQLAQDAADMREMLSRVGNLVEDMRREMTTDSQAVQKDSTSTT